MISGGRDLDNAEHLVVVLLTGLGDVVHGLPVVNALKRKYPHLRITWVAEPAPAQLLHGHSSIDHLVVYQRSAGLRGIRELRVQLRQLPPAEVALNLNVYFKSVWPTFLSRAPRRIGFGPDRSFEGVWLASNEHLPERRRSHTADMFLEFAEYLGAGTDSPEWRLSFTDDEIEQQSRFRAQFGAKPVATLIPASATPKKDWISTRWAEVADALTNDFGYAVVVAGGPGVREREIAGEISLAASQPITVVMGDSVRRLTWIIGASRLVIAPDTGPVHIARALNVPVIGLYGHTNPWRVGPWRAYSDIWIDHYTEGAPDPSNRTPKWDAMPTITVDEVMEKVKIASERYPAAPG